MKTIAFFNNKGGVGTTSLVYHLAWMFADQGLPTLAVDFDPQANLTSMFLDEDRQVANDPYNLMLLRHYRSLMPMAMDVHKPMFFLKAADGAIGAHMEAVKSCYNDFLLLAQRIADGAGIDISARH